jgi:hypothetical protein
MLKPSSSISCSRNSALASLLFVLATPLWAIPSAQQAAAPAVRDTPARDAAPDEQNTARISGRVTSLETNRPLRRARIVMSGPGLSPARSASTNSDGRFEIRDLPAGRFTLRVERNGYLPLAYGQRRPGEPGRPLELEARESVENIDFALPRMGVLSGRLVDELGEPMPDVGIWAMRVQYYQGERKLVPIGIGGHTSTDENGMYRLIALPPGEFVVMAHTRVTWPHDTNPGQTLSYAPSYYPGTAVAAAAQRVKVGMGQEIGGIDFALIPGRTSRVSGTVVTASGAPVAGESVTLTMELLGPIGGAIFPSTNVARTGSDGTFTLTNVQPGEYRLVARAPPAGDQGSQEAQEMLQVANGVDVDGLMVVTGAGGIMRGQVVTDDGSPLPPNVDRLWVRPKLLAPSMRLMGTWTSGNGHVDKTGAFELKHLFGPLLVHVDGLSGNWTLKNVLLDRRDLADEPIEVTHGASIAGVRIVLTARPTSLRGRLTDEMLRPAQGTVVIFPEGRALWRGAEKSTAGAQSRRVKAARPDQRGDYSFQGLPAGNYLVVAVDYVEEGQWGDPEYLAELALRAQRLTLTDGESKQIDLIVRR